MKPWFNVNLEPLTCIITHRRLHFTRVCSRARIKNHKRLHSSLQGILRTQHRVRNFNEYYSIHCSCLLVKTVLSVIIRGCHCFAFTTVPWIRRRWLLSLSGDIIIDQRIINEARVLSYIQAILKAWGNYFHKKKHLKMSSWWSKISFKG